MAKPFDNKQTVNKDNPDPLSIRALRIRLLRLQQAVRTEQKSILTRWENIAIHAHFLPSVKNLAAYVAFRHHDIRDLQENLPSFGLTSLGRAESDILDTLAAAMFALRLMEGLPVSQVQRRRVAARLLHRSRPLQAHTLRLFGPAPRGRWARIMVTLPTEAAQDYAIVRELLERGMDCARINCAHDGPPQWEAMIAHLRRAEGETGRPCKVLMDLAGPRSRTGPVAPGPAVLHLHTEKDARGEVTRLAGLILSPDAQTGANGGRDLHGRGLPARALVGDAIWLAGLSPGMQVQCSDLRGRERVLEVAERLQDGAVRLSCAQNVYLAEGSVLNYTAADDSVFSAALGPVAAQEGEIRLWVGDCLRLLRELRPGTAPLRDDAGQQSGPAEISCLPPELLTNIAAGQRVWMDDGKIGAEVETVDAAGATLRVTHARPTGSALHAEKGINLPDTELNLPPLMEKDYDDLDFAIAHADLVGYSFIRSQEDMEHLVRVLAEKGGTQLGIIAKIETQGAFKSLPDIIVCGAAHHPFGVMIARGDLAVEIGYQRLTEVQEEILWLCEAAHVPVIWATQVLETLVKKGIPTRAEMTDAAMAEQADCVMLNKGPYLREAVTVLDDVIGRMEAHHVKKTARLRALRSW